jgi:hypothetical protein
MIAIFMGTPYRIIASVRREGKRSCPLFLDSRLFPSTGGLRHPTHDLICLQKKRLKGLDSKVTFGCTFPRSSAV